MKFFAILVLALVAQSYASSRYLSSGENLNNRHGSRMFQENSQSSSEEVSNSNNNQKWNSWNSELEDILDESRSSSTYQFQSSASQLPQAESFKTKINQRLNGSDSLSAKPQLRRKLIKMADQKLENCKTPSGHELDKHCVGRITGQMMQLIAAVENVNRQTNFNNYRSSDY